MRIHILGVCGTFMGGIAAIAKEAGHDVTGSDQTSTRRCARSSRRSASSSTAMTRPSCRRRHRRRRQRAVARQPRGRGAARTPAARTRRGRTGRRELPARQWVLAVVGNARQDDDHQHARVDPRARGPEPGFPDRRRPGNFGISARLGGRNTSWSRATSTTRLSSTSARSSSTTCRDARRQQHRVRPRRHLPDVEAIIWQFHQLLARCPATARSSRTARTRPRAAP